MRTVDSMLLYVSVWMGRPKRQLLRGDAQRSPTREHFKKSDEAAPVDGPVVAAQGARVFRVQPRNRRSRLMR
jgi:hypothetical protein